ncbi:MAG: hypothetical protein HQM00_13215 [Magnetococcales bacterium]|nr:hypothetical protein [Magnetococcales bacterium]
MSRLCALFGFWITLGSALWREGEVSLTLFLTWFLFPLVTGALAHLLPMWWWPGLPTARREAAQRTLGRLAVLRIGAFWSGGVLISLDIPWGINLVVAPLLLFLGQVVWLFLLARSPEESNPSRP